MSDVLFDTDDHGRFHATELARGPWDPGACHAGAPSALLAGVLDASPSLTEMRIARLTYDIVRPVPLAPIEIAVEVVREGKRIQVVDAIVTTPDGVELVRCRAARIRTAEVDVPTTATHDHQAPSPAPDGLARLTDPFASFGTGFWDAVDIRPIAGDALGAPGPGTAWLRLAVPIADGVTTTPIARVAAAADYGNGIAPPLDIREHLFLNPDLTVHVHREPVGEWIALDARSVAQPHGSGLTTSALFDTDGQLGTALQSLYLDAR